jgi:parvulin-like peptidyl-prolyl isomerase
MKEGEVSGIVETNIGYHVFLVEKVEDPRQAELTEVSDFVRGEIFNRKFGEKLSKWLEEKRKNAYISYK